MNIHGSNPYIVSSSYTYSRNAMAANFTQSDKAKPRWDTFDTFYCGSTEKPPGDLIYGSTPAASAIATRIGNISYTSDDLAGIKERFADLASQRKHITSTLKKLANSGGIQLGLTDQLKVEVDSNGKIIVGGVKNARMAKELEKVINKDESLVKEIRAFRKEESDISRELRSVTGQSLTDFSARISELLKGGGMDTIRRDGPNHAYSREDCISLRDQDLYLIDNELASMISSYFTSGDSAEATITGANDILENADRAVKGRFSEILDAVNAALRNMNDSLRQIYDDPEELEERLVSLRDIIISVDSEGAILVEGNACQNSATDRRAQEMIRKIFADSLQNNPATGKRDEYFIAAQYLENQYDLAFAAADTDRKLVTTFQNGDIQSRVSSPVEERRLREEISVHAKAVLGEMGVDAENLQLEVDEKGKITVLNMPQDAEESAKIGTVLKTLNSSIGNRSNEHYNSLGKSTDPVDWLKGLMAKLDVFLPGGASLLREMRPSVEQ